MFPLHCSVLAWSGFNVTKLLPPIPEYLIEQVVAIALAEDIAEGDITSMAVVGSSSMSEAVLCAESDGIVAGISLAMEVFQSICSDIAFDSYIHDGDQVCDGAVVCKIRGPSRAILGGERTALNFLQHLSGVATLTSKFCELVKDYKVQISATRKTTPCLRYLEKWAVMVGGGSAHRQSLSDGILIKDNHLALCNGDVKFACQQAKKFSKTEFKIEVEIDALEDLDSAIDGGADIVLLDNMTVVDVATAVKAAKGRVLLEVSGGITLENVQGYAAVGPDIISVGGLTQSAPALPMNLSLSPCEK